MYCLNTTVSVVLQPTTISMPGGFFLCEHTRRAKKKTSSQHTLFDTHPGIVYHEETVQTGSFQFQPQYPTRSSFLLSILAIPNDVVCWVRTGTFTAWNDACSGSSWLNYSDQRLFSLEAPAPHGRRQGGYVIIFMPILLQGGSRDYTPKNWLRSVQPLFR